ncbi:hypothetical protein N7E81_06885 [Reichenbachiella carrageenanivorans]|uniref:PsbP protein n=1 Tax=Reichenbachiella carrageenanivorans TaxID=2979869 RepID=A0ABY6D6Q0_9BACT|nr:hypothetical protein [Reichenbachiella carrageenanivorans]UXX80823.1 hypothetical protein N7E81_06885 [Reichenbachiella carrageenanivorans]
MNSYRSITAFFFVAFSFVSLTAGAQAWRTYEWEYYNIQFELPEKFTVTTNTAEALEASAEGIRFALYPFKDSELDGLDLAGFVVKMAEEDLNLSQIDEMELLEFEEMDGGFVSGAKDGLLYMVLGLMDKNSDNNYYAFVAFEEDKQEELVEDAMEVLLSFDLLK